MIPTIITIATVALALFLTPIVWLRTRRREQRAFDQHVDEALGVVARGPEDEPRWAVWARQQG